MAGNSELLRLFAADAVDLGVISSMLQDALLPPSDMAWLRDERRFVMAVNRFRWESRDAGERVHAGLAFEQVEDVKFRNFETARRGGFLNLLSLTLSDEGEEGRAVVLMTFAGKAAIRVESASLLCHLEDFGEPWPTQWRPEHSEN